MQILHLLKFFFILNEIPASFHNSPFAVYSTALPQFKKMFVIVLNAAQSILTMFMHIFGECEII